MLLLRADQMSRAVVLPLLTVAPGMLYSLLPSNQPDFILRQVKSTLTQRVEKKYTSTYLTFSLN